MTMTQRKTDLNRSQPHQVQHRNQIILLGAGLLLVTALAGCASNAPQSQAAFDPATNTFAPCPDSPNCVSTQATDAEHGIAPIAYSGDTAATTARLVEIVNSLPRSTIVATTDNYLHAEFRSRIFRFVDDVEFFVDADSGTIQFRSASRTGYSDLGVNRKRMEEIRQLFNAGG